MHCSWKDGWMDRKNLTLSEEQGELIFLKVAEAWNLPKTVLSHWTRLPFIPTAPHSPGYAGLVSLPAPLGLQLAGPGCLLA